jgi:hypothetical protein
MNTLPGLAEWLANGEKGASSLTMAMYLGFGVMKDDACHPLDPADFDRCLRLLAAVPALREGLTRMADVSPEWAALVARWDEVERSHLGEVGLGWSKARSAPRTYELMKAIERAAGSSPASQADDAGAFRGSPASRADG